MRRRVIELIIVRHAIAYERDPVRWKDDRLRPLTAAGRRRFCKAARGISRLVEKPERVLTSPLVRAVQTAKILKKAGWPAARLCPELAPQNTPGQTLKALRAEPHARIAIVGHEPHLSRFLGACIAGTATRVGIEIKKGGTAILRFEHRLKLGHATLIALIPPRALRMGRA